MPLWMVWVASIVRPGIRYRGLGMSCQIKNFYQAFPNSLASECLFNWNAFQVLGFDAMQTSNHVPQLANVRTHWLAMGIGRPPLPKDRKSTRKSTRLNSSH